MEVIRCQGTRESRAPRRIIDLPDPFDDTEGDQIRRMAEHGPAVRLVGTQHPPSPDPLPQLSQSDALPWMASLVKRHPPGLQAGRHVPGHAFVPHLALGTTFGCRIDP